ncbi:MAG: adenylate/guanylate cyclase domain-containing protein [Armatimonadetes bacterium]|nr:adenylate/guanylate cyclase domain-containing protein [Armatimonadota bacterium]
MTDVEGSTALWEAEPGSASQAISRHDAIVDSVVGAHGGEVLKKRGEGDAAFCVFKIEEDAVAASAALQRELASEDWPTSNPIRVRIALHRGEVEDRDGDYYGATVNRCAGGGGRGSGPIRHDRRSSGGVCHSRGAVHL